MEMKLLIKSQEASKTSTKNNLETNEKEILRERFIPSKLGHKINDDLGLKTEDY